MFPTVSDFPPRVSGALREERLAQPESQKLNVRPWAGAASLIVAGAWAIRRDEQPLNLDARGETRRRLPSAQADRFGSRDERNFRPGLYVAGHPGTAQSSVRVSRRAALKTLHVGHSKAGACGARV
jgi:hypothetical protein